ncbi:RBBP9/YdeN family alpha/beta hydrolase [Glaciimonas immobilis]|uniref:Alpha/beta hydrolase n=1 Tax=Glaciimonas immobilis TaxID=728004 RepID=A0A840RWL2_9BURK|nr:alpha/beta hydrolase [Glaciimonas immobilis]KAF3996413.1 alpha/beta hydrolase [Glaciimonas immobilis]MBB5201256.1 hypothetical protein [Glaciimonas immobilis]
MDTSPLRNLSTYRFLSDFRVLVVPGLNNSGPQHWQSRWQALYPNIERVEQDQWDMPVLSRWSQRLQKTLQKKSQVPGAADKPILLVAHSFGCLTTVHCALVQAALATDSIAGALLVAPADPNKFGVSADLRAPLPFPSILVGSINDPWMEASQSVKWARLWGAEYIDAGALGHINAESQLGDWFYGQSLLERLVQKVKLNNPAC